MKQPNATEECLPKPQTWLNLVSIAHVRCILNQKHIGAIVGICISIRLAEIITAAVNTAELFQQIMWFVLTLQYQMLIESFVSIRYNNLSLLHATDNKVWSQWSGANANCLGQPTAKYIVSIVHPLTIHSLTLSALCKSNCFIGIYNQVSVNKH